MLIVIITKMYRPTYANQLGADLTIVATSLHLSVHKLPSCLSASTTPCSPTPGTSVSPISSDTKPATTIATCMRLRSH